MELEKVSPWPFVGVGALACLAFLIGASVLFLPWWAVLLLGLLWVVLMAAGARRFAVRPEAVLPLAVTGYAVWLAVVAVAALTS
ncbi:MAG: hypothetical protein ACTHJH_07070 [Marmoricola sp.]